MIDILTYAIARRKSAAKLDELYSQTKAVADAAKDSAETSKAAAETSKDLLRGYKKWLTHGNLSIIL